MRLPMRFGKCWTDFGGWPSWNPNVQKVYAIESISKGTVFKWVSGGSKIKSTIQEIDPPKMIIWTERVMGIRSIHVWSLTSRKSRTLVKAEGSYAGPVTWLFRRIFAKDAGSSFIRCVSRFEGRDREEVSEGLIGKKNGNGWRGSFLIVRVNNYSGSYDY